MNKIQKSIGILAILPLLAVALTASYIGEAYADHDEASAKVGKHAGTSTADETAKFSVRTSESDTKAESSEDNNAELISPYRIDRTGKIAYEVTFHVYAGDVVLPAGKLLVTSDSSPSKEVLFRGAPANSFASITIVVLADDISTIKAQILA